MIVNVYAFYNELLQAFANYQLDDHEPERVKMGIARDLRALTYQGKIENQRYLSLYKLGTFNDETGEFVNQKELVLNLGSVISQYEAEIKAAAKLPAEKKEA